jgi:hypothetical protein
VDPPNKIGMITVRLRRGGKYANLEGKTSPYREVQNFWDLLDCLRQDFDIQVAEPFAETDAR